MITEQLFGRGARCAASQHSCLIEAAIGDHQFCTVGNNVQGIFQGQGADDGQGSILAKARTSISFRFRKNPGIKRLPVSYGIVWFDVPRDE